MSNGQYWLLGGALALILLLSFMPTVVVDNDKEQLTNTPEQMQDDHAELPADVLQQLESERQNFEAATNRTSKANALQSLVEVFVANNKFDSAAKYADVYAIEYPSFKNSLKAGDLYYEAFTYAVSKEKAEEMGQAARKYYEQALKEKPDTLDLKVKVGMTLISPENPMRGILMIREVIEQDPSNRTALMHLGVLSINSGQLDKAEARFSTLLDFYPDDEEGLYYLGTIYAEQNKSEEAIKLFDRLEEISKNDIILQAVKKYKESLQHNEDDGHKD